jgi:hypothetical protein
MIVSDHRSKLASCLLGVICAVPLCEPGYGAEYILPPTVQDGTGYSYCLGRYPLVGPPGRRRVHERPGMVQL